MRFRVPVKPDPRPAHDLPPDFVPAEVGPNWSALPLPAIILDARGRVAAINDLAEAFFPQAARSRGPGPFKQLWASRFFLGTAALPGNREAGTDPVCGRFDEEICDLFLDASRTAEPSEALLGMLEDRPFLLDETPEPQYRPSRPLRRLVHLRDQHCCAPGCSRTVRADDLDHRVPWPLGPTSAANLAPLSRRCHRAKTTAWSLRRDPDGGHRWTSPVGRLYLVPPPWRPPPEPRLPRPPVAPAGLNWSVDGADDCLSDQLDVPAHAEPGQEQTAPRTAPGDDPPPF